MQFVKQAIDIRQRVTILNCELVQRPVVHHHPQSPILLLHKQDRAAPRRCGWLYQLFLQQVCDLLVHFLQFCRC